MSSVSDRLTKQFGRLNSIKASCSSDVFEPNVARYDDSEAKQRALLVEWLNGMLSNVNLPPKASTEELRACLIDGTVLLQILNRLRPGSVNEGIGTNHSENVKRFLAFMDQLGIPKFEMSDLEKGSLKTVMDTLLALRAQSVPGADRLSATSTPSRANGDASPNGPESRFQQAFRSPNMSEPSAASMYHVGHKFHEVFQLKHGRYVDLSAAKISEMMKSNSFDNAPTQSLLSVVNGILDESIERKHSEIPQRVACLLRKVVQEIERRISTQADHLRTQNNLFKAREEKYESRLRVLEALASGCREESGIVMEQLQQSKTQKSTVEEKKKVEEDMLKLMKKEEIQKSAMEEKKRVEEDMLKLMKAKEQKDLELSALKQELETVKRCMKSNIQKSAMEEKKRVEEDMLKLMKEKEQKDLELSALKQELETVKRCMKSNIQKSAMEEKKRVEEDMLKLMKEKEQKDLEFSALKQELETVKKKHEMHCLQMETEGKGSKRHLEEKIKELERILDASKDKMKVLEKVSNSKSQNWSKKEHICRRYMEFQFGAVRELRLSSDSIKHEIIKSQKSHEEQLDHLGARLKALVDATENYHLLLAENRKMFNELQDLKGNIRVYCRIRPFLPGQSSKQTIIQYIGENGELVVANPSKQGKDGHKMFRFNKVYGPTATQVEVFSDTQPLIRSVLDGYNVCIFAYGQTGSGKTYTMTGPSGASEEDWGVNYRALNDLFHISQNRSGSYMYEVAVQMVEIYNEQVRDLLSSGSQKRLGILSTSQPTGLAVPDASMHPVGSTSDVLELMDIGLKNRAVGATAMNERSSRSHSVVSIHVRGKDLHTSGTLQGNLHLVDLAGSERVDRSEVTGDRLREAQHINKSLSALGDVIFALAQKGPHVPYRNSKLTQLLQSSLGGQAKTLMFVQLNPDVDSYFETMSTLKFAERVSGIELGAARSSKEGRDVRELMEQVASLKDTISKKDDEIEKLQLVKDLKHVSPGSAGERLGTGSLRSGYLSTSNDALRSLSGGKDIARSEKAASDQDSYSENGDKRSASDIGQGAPSADGEGDNEERLSDASDGSFSAGTEPDGSADESTKSSDKLQKNKVASSIRRLQKHAKTKLTTVSGSRESIKSLTNTKKPSTSNLTPHKSAITKRWQ